MNSCACIRWASTCTGTM